MFSARFSLPKRSVKTLQCQGRCQVSNIFFILIENDFITSRDFLVSSISFSVPVIRCLRLPVVNSSRMMSVLFSKSDRMLCKFSLFSPRSWFLFHGLLRDFQMILDSLISILRGGVV